MTSPTIVITRAAHQAGEMKAQLEAAGFHTLLYPAIAIQPPADARALDAALRNARDYDWLILTSANAVEAVALRLQALGLPSDALHGPAIAAVGPATARAVRERLGLQVAVVPPKAVGESLLAALPIAAGQRALLPRAAQARDVLPDGLRARGVDIRVVDAYETVLGHGGDDLPAALATGQVDAITFTSPSTVRNTLRRLQIEAGLSADALAGVLIACIGPVTADAAKTAGLSVAVMPETYTVPGLVAALRHVFSG
jgi:uroporphyrinogen III methyltransferase/synthase